ncbi:MAG: LemA family protein [Verrucomicrobia bacterium]|nr:MAG: LemA family protein [Verrucomicrobiota bacterium]
MKTFLSLIGILVLAVMALGTAGCAHYNRLVVLRQATDRSWADVQNVYQRRADLIPNLVRTVEGAANFEKSTLTSVIQARQQVNRVQLDPNTAPDNPEALKRFQQTQDQLSGAISRLLVVAERYPELRATANFQDLQTQLEGTENRIAVERRKFNEAVQEYNTAIQTVPAVFYAKFLGFQPKPYFTAQEGAEKPPEVNFNSAVPASSPALPTSSLTPALPAGSSPH